MQTAKSKAYTPGQLANTERMFAALSALPVDKQRIVAMVANAFMEGMKAQELFVTGQTAVPPKETAPLPSSRKLSLLDFAEVFLTLPEASKREVLGYAKCLYASIGGRAEA